MRWALPGATCRRTIQSTQPARRPVDEAGDAQVGGFRQAAVAARDRLVGDAERRRQHPERGPRGHDQRVEKLAVNLVELTGFHGYKLSGVEFRRDGR